jgi:hypothetical protein
MAACAELSPYISTRSWPPIPDLAAGSHGARFVNRLMASAMWRTMGDSTNLKGLESEDCESACGIGKGSSWPLDLRLLDFHAGESVSAVRPIRLMLAASAWAMASMLAGP